MRVRRGEGFFFAFVNTCCWTWCRADSILTNTVQFIPWAIQFHPKASSNAAPYVRRWRSALVHWKVVDTRWPIVPFISLPGGRRSMPRLGAALRPRGCMSGGARCPKCARCWCSWHGTRSCMTIDIAWVRIDMWCGWGVRRGRQPMRWCADCARPSLECLVSRSSARGRMHDCMIVRSWLMYQRTITARDFGRSNRQCVARVYAP